jgi:hypothetical protein
VIDIILRNVGSGRKVQHPFQGMEMYKCKCNNGNVIMFSVITVSVNSSFLSSTSVGHFRYVPLNSFIQLP